MRALRPVEAAKRMATLLETLIAARTAHTNASRSNEAKAKARLLAPEFRSW
jgi:hypothetical protein